MGTSSQEFGTGKEAAFPIWDCGSPLYDSHELVSLAYTIERHMMVWPYLGGPRPITQLYDPEDVISIQCVPKSSSRVPSLSEFWMKRKVVTRQRMKKKHKKIRGRFSTFCDGLVCGGTRLKSLN